MHNTRIVKQMGLYILPQQELVVEIETQNLAQTSTIQLFTFLLPVDVKNYDLNLIDEKFIKPLLKVEIFFLLLKCKK